MKLKNKFNPQDLQQKNFTIEIKGYKVEEVNDFLDEIQADYFHFLSILTDMQNELVLLQDENSKLVKNQANLKEQNDWLDQQRIQIAKNELSNSDVMARISQIEKNLNKVLQALEQK